MPGKLDIRRYTDKEGLVNKNVGCILQDKRGFLWFGTKDGLNRYDGTEFVLYRDGATNETSLPGHTIMHLAEDPAGRIWVATNSGLCWIDPSTNVIHQLHIPGLEYPMVNSLLLQDERFLWIATSNHVHRLDIHHFTIRSFLLIEKDPRFDYTFAECLHLVNDTTLLVSGARGFFSVNTNSGLVLEELIKTGYVLSMNPYKDDQILASAWGKGTFIYDFSQCEIVRYVEFDYDDKTGTPVGLVTKIKEQTRPDGSRLLWATGGYGIRVIEGNSLKCIAEYDLISGERVHQAAGQFGYDIFEDNNGDYWVASLEGAFRIRINEPVFKKFGWDNVIQPFEHHELPDLYWLVKKNCEVALYDDFTDSIMVSFTCIACRSRNEETFVRAEMHASHGIWIRSNMDNVYYFDWNSSRFSAVRDFGRRDQPIPDARSMDITENDLWLAMPNGVCKIDLPTQALHCYTLDSLVVQSAQNAFNEGSHVFVDRNDLVWFILNHKSCFLFHPGTESFQEIKVLSKDGSPIHKERLQSYMQDKEGRIWLTSYHRVFVYNEMTTAFEERDLGFFSGITEIINDSSGRFWTINFNRLDVRDMQGDQIKQYYPSVESWTDELWDIKYHEQYNHVWLNDSGQRYVMFSPDALVPKEGDFPICLMEFRLLKSDSLISFANEAPIVLPYLQNDIRFEYAVPDFDGNNTTQYSVMLKGANDLWSDVRNNRSVIYTDLAYGAYEFWVKGIKSSGDSFPAQRLAAFTIATPYWGTWWFKTLAVIILISFVGVLYLYRVNQLKKVIRVRSKISSDLHDDVGSALTSIRVYSEMARRQADPAMLSGVLGKIEETADDMIQSMSDIVWTINPKYDDFTFVIQRMENFAANFLSLHEIEYTIHRENGVESVKLPMEKRKNLFLIFKEVINNTAKHAGCKKVDVHFAHDAHQLRMTVADDGVGFDTSILRNGNGLSNMKQRAAEMGGEIDIDSGNGKGTSVSVKVPV